MSDEPKPAEKSETKPEPLRQTKPKGEVQLTERELNKVAGGITPGGWNRVKNVATPEGMDGL
jgi:hypothetical protein